MRIIIVFALLLLSCVPPQKEAVQRIPFPQKEYDALPTTGTGIVKGQAFLKTRGGDVKTAAGNEVLLNPVTSYSNQWYEIGYLQNTPLTTPDSRYAQYQTRKIADGYGRFEFTNVPPGEYYLTALVIWEAPTGYGGALQAQGGYISNKIVVQNNKITEVILTR